MIPESASEEPILRPSLDRFLVFPIKYPKVWSMYQKAKRSLWSSEEIVLNRDIEHWTDNLSVAERRTLSSILAFFASSDGIVSENLAARFMSEVQIPEARSFYAVQIMTEAVHAETYSKLLLTLVDRHEDRDRLFRSLDTIPVIRDKADWALRWIEKKDCSFDARLVAFAAVEGIFFSSSFAIIFWFKERGLMPGLTFSNELISRDEGLHTEFACSLHRHMLYPISETEITAIVVEAVLIEKAFVRECLFEPLLGLNSSLMELYIEYVADKLLAMLLCPPYFGVANPLSFMNTMVMSGKANFFERQVSEYAQEIDSGSGNLDKSIFELPDV